VARRRWLAATGVVLLAIIAVVLATGVIFLPVHTPGSKPLALTVVSRTGPIAAPDVDILAATSVADLRALAVAANLGNQHVCDPPGCWSSVTVAQPSLLIALQGGDLCHKSVLSADLDSVAHLTIHEVLGGLTCPIGNLALPAPSYWLLAVPLEALPSTILSVAADSTAAGFLGAVGGHPLNRGGRPTTVDLRPPVPGQADSVTSTAELRAAVQTGQRDAELRAQGGYPTIIGLALRRWPKADLGCGSDTNDTDLAWGSLMVFRADTPTNAAAYEYHELQGRTVFCRVLTP
jgi:hypothetical protein